MSTSSTIIVSVRRLQRPVPASAPTSNTTSLPSARHSDGKVLGPLTLSGVKIGIPASVVGPGVGGAVGVPDGPTLAEPSGDPERPALTVAGGSVAPC